MLAQNTLRTLRPARSLIRCYTSNELLYPQRNGATPQLSAHQAQPHVISNVETGLPTDLALHQPPQPELDMSTKKLGALKITTESE